MLTAAGYALFIASLLFTSLYPALIVAKALRVPTQSTPSPRSGGGRSLAIVVPSRGEPLDMVVSRLGRLSSMGCYDEALLVLDDDIDYVRRLVARLGEGFFARGVVVARTRGYGGRNGALTCGSRMALADSIMIVDVDTTPSQELLCAARACEDVCVGVWNPYVETGRRIEEGMAYITGFGSWVFYELKSRLGLFVFPLGTGTVIDRRLLKSIGFWRADVVQDDIWLGCELAARGVRPRLMGGYIEVGVPQSLRAARIQQCRWSYGSSNVLSRFAGKLLGSPLGFLEKLEAVVYMAQPLAAVVALAAFVLALAGSIAESGVSLSVLHLVPVALSMAIQGAALNLYGSRVRGLGTWRRVCLAGRVGAIYTLLSPLLGFYALRGLLRMRYRYRVTPKMLTGSSSIDAAEAVALLLSLPTIALSILNGNSVTLIIALPLALAALYSIARLEKG